MGKLIDNIMANKEAYSTCKWTEKYGLKGNRSALEPDSIMVYKGNSTSMQNTIWRLS